MGSSVSRATSKKCRVKPITVLQDKIEQLNKQLQAVRLILNNEPFVYSFGQYVASEFKEKEVFISYYEELERIKGLLERLDKIELTSKRAIVLKSIMISNLFYSSEKSFPNKAAIEFDTTVRECLLPLLLSHEVEGSGKRGALSTVNMIIPELNLLLYDCQTNLLIHILPELLSYVQTERFSNYHTSKVLVYRSIFQQVCVLLSCHENLHTSENNQTRLSMIEMEQDYDSRRVECSVVFQSMYFQEEEGGDNHSSAVEEDCFQQRFMGAYKTKPCSSASLISTPSWKKQQAYSPQPSAWITLATRTVDSAEDY